MKLRRLVPVSFILIFLSTQLVTGQGRYTISGEVTDAATGERLIGATIFVEGTTQGVISNTYGFYSLSLQAGHYNLVVSYVGYENLSYAIRLEENTTKDFKLSTSETALEEVVVSAQRADHNVSSTDIGIENLNIKALEKVPVLMGETDILKTIQLMPGISTVSEGSSGFSVRGGSTDQNLILLDEATVYNASHLMGFFSVFNSDALMNATVYKGGIPANFGGRVSSVLDIQMKDGNNQEFTGKGGIGLISSRLTVEGPLSKGKSSLIVSGRRSYADIVAYGLGILDERATLYFYDLNTKLNLRVGDKDRIFLSGYFGRDDFGYEGFGTVWGNMTGTFRWNHVFNGKLFLNSTFIYSQFEYGFNLDSLVEMSSGIEDIGWKEDFTWYISPEHTMKFGLNATYHNFNPGELISSSEDTVFNINMVLPKKQALESGLYLTANSRFGSRISAEYGLRVSMFNQLGEGTHYEYNEFNERIDSVSYEAGEVMKTYVAAEPRLSVNYRISQNSSVKASYNRMAQYLHILSNTTTSQPMDTWVPSTTHIKPVLVNQYSLGYFRNFLDNKIEFSLETYYKDMHNIYDYKPGANMYFNEDIEAIILPGIGRSYGMEFYLKKKTGDFTGWISYTLSRTENLVEGVSEDWYPSAYDKIHDLSIVGSYDILNWLSVSASWIYYTGNARTFPSGKGTYDGYIIPRYTERNGDRMPDYHRLDLNIHIDGKKDKKVRSGFDISVYNAYHRYNAYTIFFRESDAVPGNTEAVKLALFGIVPSISWSFEF